MQKIRDLERRQGQASPDENSARRSLLNHELSKEYPPGEYETSEFKKTHQANSSKALMVFLLIGARSFFEGEAQKGHIGIGFCPS